MKIDPDGEFWWALEVDLDYPQELHDLHNDYPMAVEKKAVKTEDLSEYNRKFLENLGEKHKPGVKLIPDLNNKRNYVCSLKNLQFYIKHGLVLKKVHRVLSARQEAWMEPFIAFNTLKRTECTTKFGKDFFKMVNNSSGYGKLIENVYNYRDVKAVTSEFRAKRLVSSPRVL